MSECPCHDGSVNGSGEHVPSRRDKLKKKVSVLGFETELDRQKSLRDLTSDDHEVCNYTDYIQTEELLRLQEGKSMVKPNQSGMMHHEELLFIVTHQSIELWFKVLLADLKKGRDLLITSYSPEGETEQHGFSSWKNLELVGHYLRRGTMIFLHAAESFALLQTMHPADFLEFRDYLVPASGFQSFQFRQIELLLGTNEEKRVMCNGEHVFNALHEDQKKSCENIIANETSIKDSIEELLLHVNVPESFLSCFYEATEKIHISRQKVLAHHSSDKAKELADAAVEEIKSVIDAPDPNMSPLDPIQKRLHKVMVAALYVSSYREEHPHFASLSEVLDDVIALEEGLLLFRARHLHNAERVIGHRRGTCGSSGVEYLEKTRAQRIFTVLWSLRRVFIRSSILPSLSTLHDDAAISEITVFKRSG